MGVDPALSKPKYLLCNTPLLSIMSCAYPRRAQKASAINLTAVRDISGTCQRLGEHSVCRQYPGKHNVVPRLQITSACFLLTYAGLCNRASPFLESPENGKLINNIDPRIDMRQTRHSTQLFRS